MVEEHISVSSTKEDTSTQNVLVNHLRMVPREAVHIFHLNSLESFDGRIFMNNQGTIELELLASAICITYGEMSFNLNVFISPNFFNLCELADDWECISVEKTFIVALRIDSINHKSAVDDKRSRAWKQSSIGHAANSSPTVNRNHSDGLGHHRNRLHCCICPWSFRLPRVR